MRSDSTSEVILSLLDQLDRDSAAKFGMVLWQIWRERNSKFWNGSNKSPQVAVHTASVALQEWVHARGDLDKNTSSTRGKCLAWHAPPLRWLKLNVDAAFFEDSCQMGFGFVLRNDQGSFVAARSMTIDGCLETDVGEAMGFLEALSWIKRLNIGNVEIEGDARVVVDAIKGSDTCITSFGDIILACRSVLAQLDNVFVSFVRRNANSLAHATAKVSRNFESPSCWVDPPPFVVGLPADICICK